MHLSCNHVYLVGTLHGEAEMRFTGTSGAQYASIILQVEKITREGKTFTSRIPVNVYGSGAALFDDAPAGALVEVRGELQMTRHPAGGMVPIVASMESRVVALPQGALPAREGVLL